MHLKYRKSISILVFFLTGTPLFVFLAVPVSTEATICIIAPTPATWNLRPDEIGNNSIVRQLVVTTIEADGKNWQATASDLDTVNTNGFLTKYSGSHDAGTKLANPLQVVGPDGVANLPDEGVLKIVAQ